MNRAPAKPLDKQAFCSRCYLAGIERLCNGFTLASARRKIVITVPPLPAVLAADVRRAARQHIEQHGRGDTPRHPRHAGIS